jgi:SH3-like domain-containing protein
MIRSLLTAALLLGPLVPATAPAAGGGERVVVQDAYLEFRTGPGRGFPVFHVVDRGESVELLRRRTDWIKVRVDGGKEGWVNRSQLERTLTPGGAAGRAARRVARRAAPRTAGKSASPPATSTVPASSPPTAPGR